MTEYTAGTRLACHSHPKGATMATVAKTGSATRSIPIITLASPYWLVHARSSAAAAAARSRRPV